MDRATLSQRIESILNEITRLSKNMSCWGKVNPLILPFSTERRVSTAYCFRSREGLRFAAVIE